MKNYQEWNIKKNFNPFNSLKVLAHLDRWRTIKKGEKLPPPVLVTIDPTSACNLNCVWCNSRIVIDRLHKARKLSKIALANICNILDMWNHPDGQHKVRAVCIAGGGEPLLNKNISFLIDKLVNKNIDIGVVTNGSFIHNFIKSLSKCHWVSVSVDSGTGETFAKLKNTNVSEFDRVIENMKALIKYSRENDTRLAQSPLSYGVTYKFLVHKDNIHEISIAAKLAKSIGCKSIHIRPVGRPWYGKNPVEFNEKQLALFYEQIEIARKLEDKKFSVYGVTHKFTKEFKPKNNFSKCYAIFMTTVFMPPRLEDSPDSFVMNQCCDRRGDKTMELGHNIKNLQTVMNKWGNSLHWKIQEGINLNQCPRCTYSPHNEIYEQVLLEDNMSIDFI